MGVLKELLFLVVLFIPWEVYGFIEYSRWKAKVRSVEFRGPFSDWYYGCFLGTRPMSQAVKEGSIVVLVWISWAFLIVATLG